MRKTASSAILLLSDLFRKEFLRTTANSIASRMTEFSSTLTHRLTSKIVSHCTVKSAPLTELGCADTNTAAVAEFIDFIEDVHDIETDVECRLLRDLDSARQADVECLIGVVLFGIGKTSAQSVSIKSVDGQSPVVPRVRNASRPSETLIVVEEDPVFLDVSELIWVEKKLRGTDIGPTRPFVSDIQVRRVRTVIIA